MKPSAALIPLIVTLMLPLGVRAAPSAFADRVMEAVAPPSDSSGPVRDVVRWGGRLFVQCDTRTWWSADAGRTWKHCDWFKSGPKGTVPSLDLAWFTRATDAIWLGNRNGPLAWTFDTVAGAWAECAIGKGVVAAAGAGDRLYALSGDHALRQTSDAGVTWVRVPMPDSIGVGSFFDDLQADGDGVILRARDLANSQRPAATLDGGKTWRWLPAHAPTALAHGCAYAVADARLAGFCPEDRVFGETPFASPKALFTAAGGAIFAFADSTLFAADAGAMRNWSVLAAAEDLRGWDRARDVLFCVRGGTLSWFNGAAAVSGIRLPGPSRPGAGPKHHGLWYEHLGRGYDGLGRIDRRLARARRGSPQNP